MKNTVRKELKKPVHAEAPAKRRPCGIIMIVFVLLLAAGVYYFYWLPQEKIKSVNSFEECAAAGYGVMEMYPARCRTPDGRTFTQEVECVPACGDGVCQRVKDTRPNTACVEDESTCPLDCNKPEEITNMSNPASEYCVRQGGKALIAEDTEGNQQGICLLPDGTECDEWAYFRGTCPAQGVGTGSNDTGAESTDDDPVDEKEDGVKINFDCITDEDCVIKDVGSLCGTYPMCVNTEYEPRPPTIPMELCDFQEIDGCQCFEGRCAGLVNGTLNVN